VDVRSSESHVGVDMILKGDCLSTGPLLSGAWNAATVHRWHGLRTDAHERDSAPPLGASDAHHSEDYNARRGLSERKVSRFRHCTDSRVRRPDADLGGMRIPVVRGPGSPSRVLVDLLDDLRRRGALLLARGGMAARDEANRGLIPVPADPALPCGSSMLPGTPGHEKMTWNMSLANVIFPAPSTAYVGKSRRGMPRELSAECLPLDR
jgi:hypothetical protein